MIKSIATWEESKDKVTDRVSKVLAASCQHISFHSFYTLHLIYLPTTAACCYNRAKPLLLQSDAQDSPPKRVQSQVYFTYVKLQQRSNPARAYKESNRWVKSRQLQVATDLRQPLEV